MPRRDPGGNTWRCDNPECLSWTWVSTSATRCFRCLCPAPVAARSKHRVLLSEVSEGHREQRGFFNLPAAAAWRVDPARAGQLAPWPVGNLPPPAGPAGHPLPPPPPSPPARGHSHGRTGAGAATYARNPNRDFREIGGVAAAGDYREGGRAAAARQPRASGGPAQSFRRSQQLRGGDGRPFGGSGSGLRSPGGGSPGSRFRPRVAAAGFRAPAEPDHDYPPLRSDSEC